MKNDDLSALLRDVRVCLAELEAEAGATKPRAVAAYERLSRQAESSFPRGGGGGGRGKGDHSDPVLQAVLDDDRKAEARRILDRRAELVDLVKTAMMKLQHAAKITDTTLRTEPPERYNPGCTNCGRVTVDGKPHPEAWQEVKARGVCGWCYRFQFGDGPARPGYGEPPTIELLRWHLDHLGTEPPRTLVRDLMPDAFRAREERKRNPERQQATDGAPTWARPDTNEELCVATKWSNGIEVHCTLAPGHVVDHVWADSVVAAQ